MMSVTDLEIKEATWGAWTILYAGAPPCARRLAAALLAVTREYVSPSPALGALR